MCLKSLKNPRKLAISPILPHLSHYLPIFSLIKLNQAFRQAAIVFSARLTHGMGHLKGLTNFEVFEIQKVSGILLNYISSSSLSNCEISLLLKLCRPSNTGYYRTITTFN